MDSVEADVTGPGRAGDLADRLRRAPAAAADGAARARRPHGRALALWAVVAVLVGQMAAAMLLSARGDAPTFDEQVHLTGGIAYLRHSALRINYEHPPLVKLLAGLGPVAGGVRTPDAAAFETARQGVVARATFYELGNDPDALLWRGRLPMMAVAVALALLVFGFARDLFGTAAALVPLALVTLDPNVLGHGRLVTTDVGMTLLVVACLWALWRARRRSWRWLPLAGVAFGLALAAKFSALLLAPAIGVLAFGVSYARARAGARASRPGALLVAAGGTALVAVLAVAVVWVVYLGIDPGLRFNPALYPARGALAKVADLSPLPHPYRAGLRYVLFFDQHDRPAYLFGERYEGGRLLFYPAVLAIKTPLATLAAWALALAALAVAPRERRLDAAAFLLFPAAWLLALAMTSQTNIGVRHVLLVPVLLAVATGALWRLRPRGRSSGRPGDPRVLRSPGPPLGAAVAVVLVLLAGIGVWRAHPSYLAYVNEAFGGPARGWRLVADSNLDWGQDLARAAAYVRDRHTGEPVWLLYFGSADPRAYGLYAVDLFRTKVDRARVHGLVLVSASVLALYPEQRWVAQGREPVAQIGHSILVYRLP